MGPCLGCVIPIELDFAYEGGCELTLPEPIDFLLIPYAHIELGGQSSGIGAPGASCVPGACYARSAVAPAVPDRAQCLHS